MTVRVFALLGTLAATVTLIASPVGATSRRFKGWVSDPRLGADGYPAKRTLRVNGSTGSGGAPVIFLFVDKRERGTRWKVCVERKDGRPPCATGRTGAPGLKSGRPLFPLPPGNYAATWTVKGKVVTTWAFQVVK